MLLGSVLKTAALKVFLTRALVKKDHSQYFFSMDEFVKQGNSCVELEEQSSTLPIGNSSLE